jgi:8-oxo-dGTP pyrophosphatase MutT (NUDIX family)
MLETALREAWEEIGIDRETVQVLAHLPPMDTRTSGFRIHPFLARITRPTQWRRSEREVAEVLEVGLGDLMRPEAHVEEAGQLPSVPEAPRAPFYRVGPYQLWGVTYRILHPLIPRLLRGEWNV